MIDSVRRRVEQGDLFKRDAPVVIAFSGGVDSRVLLDVLCQLAPDFGWRVIAAHLDHEWRTTSAIEADWCAQVAREHGIDFELAQYAQYCAQNPQLATFVDTVGSAEAQARTVRYHFLRSVAQKNGAQCIALAHHLDDQIETFFIRLIRGAGLEGLAGMQQASTLFGQCGVSDQVRLVRPFLTVADKAKLTEYARDCGFIWIEDPTNQDEAYLRSCIRRRVMPALVECDQRALGGIERAMRHMAEAHVFVEQYVRAVFERGRRVDEYGHVWVSLALFDQESLFIQKQILLFWLCWEQVSFTPSEALYNEILRFLCGRITGEHILYGKWKIVCKKGWATITSLE